MSVERLREVIWERVDVHVIAYCNAIDISHPDCSSFAPPNEKTFFKTVCESDVWAHHSSHYGYAYSGAVVFISYRDFVTNDFRAYRNAHEFKSQLQSDTHPDQGPYTGDDARLPNVYICCSYWRW